MRSLLGFFFDTALGKAAAAAAGLAALVMAFAWDQRMIGGERAIRKLEQAEGRANAAAGDAAGKSGSGVLTAAGKRAARRDPTTRDD